MDAKASIQEVSVVTQKLVNVNVYRVLLGKNAINVHADGFLYPITVVRNVIVVLMIFWTILTLYATPSVELSSNLM